MRGRLVKCTRNLVGLLELLSVILTTATKSELSVSSVAIPKQMRLVARHLGVSTVSRVYGKLMYAGPVVRINPYEIHIHDTEFIDEVYPGSSVRRTEKYEWAMRMFGIRFTFIATIDHDLHRLKRKNFAPYLSKATLQKLEPGIQSVIDHMVFKLREIQGTGKVFNLLDLFSCLTGQ